MRFLGIIPARAGSKGILKKNIVSLAGKPLIAYTCEAAKKSRYLENTIVSTDSKEIATIAEDRGVDVPFLRPATLAKDETPMLPVVQHAIQQMSGKEGTIFDAIVLLQPTSPLRTGKHIDRAIHHFEESVADTLVSVVEVPHNFHPLSLMVEGDDGWLEPYEGKNDLILRRQEKPTAYARNGPAVLVTTRPTVMNENTLYGKRIGKFEMTEKASLDIDGPDDLTLAEFYLRRNAR